jgi:hypothetical protein
MTISMDSEDRWYDAARRADDTVVLRLLRFRTLKPGTLSWTIVPLVIALVVGYGLAFWRTLGGEAGADVLLVAEPLATWLLRFVGGATLLYGVIGLLYLSVVTKPWNLVIGALNGSEKREVRRQIAGDDVLDEEKLPLVVVMAKQRHKMFLGFAPVYAGVFFFSIYWALTTHYLDAQLVSVVVSAALIVVGIWMLVAFRRTDAFISSHAHLEYVPTRAYTLALKAQYPDPLTNESDRLR